MLFCFSILLKAVSKRAVSVCDTLDQNYSTQLIISSKKVHLFILITKKINNFNAKSFKLTFKKKRVCNTLFMETVEPAFTPNLIPSNSHLCVNFCRLQQNIIKSVLIKPYL